MDRAERSRTTVLVVEDDAAMRELLMEALTDEGYRVELAVGGRAGIQRVREGGKAETLITEVEGIRLNGPNDLVFAPDGSLVFSDPGTYNPKSPDPSYIHRLLPDGTAKVLVAFPKPVFPNGVTAEAAFSLDGSRCMAVPDFSEGTFVQGRALDKLVTIKPKRRLFRWWPLRRRHEQPLHCN